MIPSSWRNWTDCLGLAAACLILVGCGGSDVPDPDADTGVASASDAPPQAAQPPQVAAADAKAEEPTPEKAEEPAAPAAQPTAAPETPVAKADLAPKTDAPPKLAAAAPTLAESTAPAASADAATAQPPATPDAQPKPEGGATAAEMLALSSGNSPTTPPPAAGTPGAPAPGAQAPGGPAATAGGPAFAAGRNNGFGAGGPTKPDDDTPAKGAMARTGGRRDDYEDVGGGRNRPPRDNAPVNFNNPRSSVQAFLDALEDKDVDRLSEATALRSPYEAKPKNQELFKKIVDGSISEAQLNDLAENLDQYTISGEAQVKSTGRLDILVSKTTDTGMHQRTITVRKEKAGWKVLDISSIIDFKMNAPTRGRGRTTRSR